MKKLFKKVWKKMVGFREEEKNLSSKGFFFLPRIFKLLLRLFAVCRKSKINSFKQNFYTVIHLLFQ